MVLKFFRILPITFYGSSDSDSGGGAKNSTHNTGNWDNSTWDGNDNWGGNDGPRGEGNNRANNSSAPADPNAGFQSQITAMRNELNAALADNIGKPEEVEWTSPLDEDYNLPENLRMQAGEIDNTYDSQYMDAMSDRAFGAGESPWLSAALGRQGLEESGMRQTAQEVADKGTAEARAYNAMRGGLRSGASERIADTGQKNLLNSWQDIARYGQQDRAGLQTQEEGYKQNLMSQLPGMESQRAAQDLLTQQYNVGQQNQSEQFNIQNALTEGRLVETAKQKAYAEQMRAWAAGKTGEAYANAGDDDSSIWSDLTFGLL